MITFTQYLRPNGRRALVSINCSPEIEAKAAKLSKVGAIFEIEMLPTKHVSMTVEVRNADNSEDSTTLAHLIVKNGPDVPPTVERLVEKAWSALHHDPPE